jgi:hypothetical protein
MKMAAAIRVIGVLVTVLVMLGSLVLAFWKSGAGATILLIGAGLLCAVVSAWVRKGGINLFGMLYWIGAALIAAVDCVFPDAEVLDSFVGLYFIPLRVLPLPDEPAFPIVTILLCALIIAGMILVHILVRWKTPDPKAE